MSTNINMNKQYRSEIRDLKRHRRELIKTYNAERRQANRELAATGRELARITRGMEKALAGLDRRVAILSGRLS